MSSSSMAFKLLLTLVWPITEPVWQALLQDALHSAKGETGSPVVLKITFCPTDNAMQNEE
jgi:hypothetical protein